MKRERRRKERVGKKKHYVAGARQEEEEKAAVVQGKQNGRKRGSGLQPQEGSPWREGREQFISAKRPKGTLFIGGPVFQIL